MSKELEALERIKSICINYMCGFTVVESSKESEKKINTDLNIIKETLEDHEMEHILRVRLSNVNYELVREKQDNEKKLKALEIINEKEWFVDFMKEHLNREWFTKEELNSLKEVLL